MPFDPGNLTKPPKQPKLNKPSRPLKGIKHFSDPASKPSPIKLQSTVKPMSYPSTGSTKPKHWGKP